jgi:hypothetical protein
MFCASFSRSPVAPEKKKVGEKNQWKKKSKSPVPPSAVACGA